MPNTVQHRRRLGSLAAPPTLLQGQLAINDPGSGTPARLYGGGDVGVVTLVSPTRQVELAGDQTITGNKTFANVGLLHVNGGGPGYLLSTDGIGNLSWVPGDGSLPSPGGVVTGNINFTGGISINGIPVVADAPADGRLYVRGNESWVILPWDVGAGGGGGGGGVPEAPSVAGQVYGRSGAVSNWIPVLPLTGGAMLGNLILDGPPSTASPSNQAATKGYVDGLVTGALQFIGTMNGVTGIVTYTASSGFVNGPLVVASLARDQYVLVAVAGTVPSGPIGGQTVGVLDWIISDGTSWSVISHTQIDMTASNVVLNPTVWGQTDVQAALEHAETSGLAGESSFTHVTADFTPPAANATVTVNVASTAWMDVGTPIFIEGATYVVDTVNSGTSVTLRRVDTSGGGFPEAPTDGRTYGRQGSTTSWVPTLPLSGGTMTGAIIFADTQGDPTAQLKLFPPSGPYHSALGIANADGSLGLWFRPTTGEVDVDGPLFASGGLTIPGGAITFTDPQGSPPAQIKLFPSSGGGPSVLGISNTAETVGVWFNSTTGEFWVDGQVNLHNINIFGAGDLAGHDGWLIEDAPQGGNPANPWNLHFSQGGVETMMMWSVGGGGVQINNELNLLGNLLVTGRAHIQGVTDGSNAAPGEVGEYLGNYAQVPVPGDGSTVVPVTSIQLTPGDWEVAGELGVDGADFTNLYTDFAPAANTPTPHASATNWNLGTGTTFGGGTSFPTAAAVRFSSAMSSQVFLRVRVGSVGGVAVQVWGSIWARRVR